MRPIRETYLTACGIVSLGRYMKVCRFKKHNYSKDFKQCPICKKSSMKAYRDANKEKINSQIRDWHAVNKTKHKEYMKHYYQNNKAECKRRVKLYVNDNSVKRKNYFKAWYAVNKKKVFASNTEYRKHHPLLKLRGNLSALIRGSFKKKGYSKKSKTFTLVGCDFEFLLIHLVQSAIKNYGCFESISDYHIDHIIPCSSAKNEIELIKLQHYSNLQFLKPNDNMNKKDKLDWVLPIRNNNAKTV